MHELSDSTHRLHHSVPSWIPEGSIYHVRIRVDDHCPVALTSAGTAPKLLQSAAHYHLQGRWYCHLFLLMPDHLHALLSFPPDSAMVGVIGKWKAWHARTSITRWQSNFFDHRIRNTAEFHEKAAYIRRNPVVRNLCSAPDAWPWLVDLNSMGRWH